MKSSQELSIQSKTVDFTWASLQTIMLCSEVTVDKKEMQDFLDAIVDEIHISDSDSDFDMKMSTDMKSHSSTKEFGHQTKTTAGHYSTQLPKIRVSASFNDEMEQYLFGYGEDYGGPSSVNIISSSQQESKENKSESDINSVEVQTSLDSSINELPGDDAITDSKLPSEKESVFDQVQRLQASIEQHDNLTKKVCTIFKEALFNNSNSSIYRHHRKGGTTEYSAKNKTCLLVCVFSCSFNTTNY